MSRRDDGGAVTAETAMALPVLALFTLSMAWLISLGITQVRVVDAAREAARAAARSESSASARVLAAQVAPAGSSVRVTRSGGTVTVRVSSPLAGPAGLLGDLAGLRVRASAVAAEEPGR